MIESFKDKKTEAFFEGKRIKEWQHFHKQAEKRLQILDSATCLEDLIFLPSNRLESLGGKRNNQYSIRINKQWRICFKWIDDKAENVEIVDYH